MWKLHNKRGIEKTTYWSIWVLFFLLFISFSCVNQESVRLKNLGAESLKNGALEEALTYYTKALRFNPNDPVVKQRIEEIKKRLAEKYYNQGVQYTAERKLESALTSFKKSLEYYPLKEASANIGLVTKEIDRARELYQKALARKVDKQFEEAISFLEEASKINVEEPLYKEELKTTRHEAAFYYKKQADTFIKKGDIISAKMAIEKAASFESLPEIKESLKEINSFETLSKDCKRFLTELSTSKGLLFLKDQWEYLKANKDKLDLIKECHQWTKVLVDAYFQQAEYLRQHERLAEAKKIVKDILNEFPDFQPAKDLLSMLVEEYAKTEYKKVYRDIKNRDWLSAIRSLESLKQEEGKFLDSEVILARLVDRVGLFFYRKGKEFWEKGLYGNSYLCFRIAGELTGDGYRDSFRRTRAAYDSLKTKLQYRIKIKPVKGQFHDPFLWARIGDELALSFSDFSHPYVHILKDENVDFIAKGLLIGKKETAKEIKEEVEAYLLLYVNFLNVDHTLSYSKGVHKYTVEEKVMNEEYIKLRDRKDDLYKELALTTDREERRSILERITEIDKQMAGMDIMKKKAVPKEYIYDIKHHKLTAQGEFQVVIFDAATGRQKWGKLYQFEESITDKEVNSRYDIGLEGDPLTLPSEKKFKIEVARRIIREKIAPDLKKYLENYGLEFWQTASAQDRNPTNLVQVAENYIKFIFAYQGKDEEKIKRAKEYIKNYGIKLLSVTNK